MPGYLATNIDFDDTPKRPLNAFNLGYGGVQGKGSTRADILTKKAVYGVGKIHYFEFEDSETGFGRMLLSYADPRSQKFRTQNIRICLGTFVFLKFPPNRG